MDEKNKSPEPTPEQLLKMLDIQMATLRERRSAQAPSRTAMRVFSLSFILIGVALALWVLMHLLEEMQATRPDEAPPAQEDVAVEISH